MSLPKWAEQIVARLVESATQLSQSDVCKSLCDALKTLYPGQYCYPVDIYGDDQSGDVVYCCGNDYKRAPYEIQYVDGKRAVSIDTASAVDVLPRTQYDEEADEAAHYASSESARENYSERFPGSTQWKFAAFSERFISKAERDSADDSDFAGTGRSFPILKKSDIMAAVRSIGRGVAGGQKADAIKAGIKRIAKRKGWTDALPQAWQAATATEAGEIEITGDLVPIREGAVGQDGTAYLKLIAPGWGSSGYYSKEVLKRDGPAIFKAGTKNFWNHPTAAEESSRPEGDLRDLASVLTEDARYDDNGPAGPGLYAKANVMPHFREHVDSLAKHIGMSIRASGRAKEGKAEGKSGPIIEQLSRGVSVDYVTTPGAGGKILQLFEAARSRQSITGGDNDMDEATIKRLISESVTAALAPISTKLKESEQPKLKRGKTIRKIFESMGVQIPGVYKDLLVERVKANYPLTEAGVTDDTRLKALVESELKKIAKRISAETGRVVNLGASAGAATNTQAVSEAAAKQHTEAFKESLNDLADIFLDVTSETPKEQREFRRNVFSNGRAA